MRILAIFLSAFVCFFQTNFAWALNSEVFAEHLKTALSSELQGSELKYDSVETDGQNVTLNGFRLIIAQRLLLYLGNVVFVGVSESEDYWRVKSIDIDGTSSRIGSNAFWARNIKVRGLQVPSINAKGVKRLMNYEQIGIENFGFTRSGIVVFGFSNFQAVANANTLKGLFASKVSVENVFLDLIGSNILLDPRARLEDAFLTQVNFTVEQETNWAPVNGVYNVDITLKDAKRTGQLRWSLQLSGFTDQYLDAVRMVDAATQINGKNNRNVSARQLARIGLAQQLFFVESETRFDDAGLIVKALDFAAGKQDTTRDAIAQQLKGSLPFVLGQLESRELIASATTAILAFLDNPKNITVNAKPSAPVAGITIMATGAADPMELIKKLNVQVKADE